MFFTYTAHTAKKVVEEGNKYTHTHTKLVRVSETAHTRHNTEDVVVGRVDVEVARAKRGLVNRSHRRGSEGQLESCVINTGHIAGA